MATNILIVDDDPEIRNSIQEYLTVFKYVTFTATNAEEAMDLLKIQPVDVIITDILMNGMDGLEMTQRIKEKYDTDIIVITGYARDYSYEDAISKGADDFVFKPIRLEELLLRLKRVIRERELTQERTKMLVQLKELSITDDLTKLYNSRHFYQQLQNEVKRFYRYHRPLALLLIDIDHFKYYNDTYGHLEGDKILFKIGGLISSCLRAMDTAYRYGGEEFTVILPETSCEAALIVAERILRTVQTNFFDENSGMKITVSIGVSEYSDGESMNDFIKRTDKAMYNAKGKGRNCITFLMP
ncbi:MAG: diguanylate cyclase [Desulfobacterales bacterium]|jgi:diguanylate cyclase (GGDEF)-like protein|nr:diguanylate cyclase [Desulfobacterales bacterium]